MASATEEGRYPRYNIVVTPRKETPKLGIGALRFESARPLTTSELRRLAPAADIKKSAIWVEYEDAGADIVGLIDLGTSWHRARSGFAYKYSVPHSLVVQVDRPGRLKVYEGEFHIATLADGELTVSTEVEYHLFLHGVTNNGLQKLVRNFSIPKHETPRDFESFWFTAHWNIFASIANAISLSEHGGTLVIAEPADVSPYLQSKYPFSSDVLRKAFINFINARNETSDYYTKLESDGGRVSSRVFKAELILSEATDELIESTRFIAQLAGCDGAIVISPDLVLFGFGTEIRTELASDVSVLEVLHEMHQRYKRCNVEQFGMRHRSAIKLASQNENCLVLAISQDGPISAIWRKGSNVFVKKTISLTNMNMPWM